MIFIYPNNYSKVDRETVDYRTCKVCRTGEESVRLCGVCYMIAGSKRKIEKMIRIARRGSAIGGGGSGVNACWEPAKT